MQIKKCHPLSSLVRLSRSTSQRTLESRSNSSPHVLLLLLLLLRISPFLIISPNNNNNNSNKRTIRMLCA